MENIASFQPDFSRLAAVFFGLVLVGIFYNIAVSSAIRKGYLEGYVWASVAVGTLITLGGLAIVDWRAACQALVCFAGSGLPMAIGSWWRTVKARRDEQIAYRTGEHER